MSRSRKSRCRLNFDPKSMTFILILYFRKELYALTAIASNWMLLAASMLTYFRVQNFFFLGGNFQFSSARDPSKDPFPRLALRCIEARSFQGF